MYLPTFVEVTYSSSGTVFEFEWMVRASKGKSKVSYKYSYYRKTHGTKFKCTQPCESQESLIIHRIGFLNSLLIPTYSTHLKMTFNFLFTRRFQRYVICQGSGNSGPGVATTHNNQPDHDRRWRKWAPRVPIKSQSPRQRVGLIGDNPSSKKSA